MGFFLYIYIMDLTQFQDLSVEQINDLSLRLKIKQFKDGNFDFIVQGEAQNNEGDWEIGEWTTHKRQEEALKILTGNKYNHLLYGGGANGAKSWTGVCWITFSALAYKNTNWFIARNQLKDLLGSVFSTFRKVCREYDIVDYNFNAQKNYIDFPNGSRINLIEVAYKPSDPMYEDVGSTEYTGGWIEEVGEVHRMAYVVLSTRIGRHLNRESGINGTLFMTCNPKQNWAKTMFYDKHINGSLYAENEILLQNGQKPPQKIYLNCLATQNPFAAQENINNLYSKANDDKATYERLLKGNWDYEDNPNQLAEQEMIEQVFDNDHVEEGYSYLTADVAFQGADLAVIIAWKGWVAKEILTEKISNTQKITNHILLLRRKYRIPKSRCIVDADGGGIGVTDISGAKRFHNGGSVIRQGNDSPNYRNLQVQCLYMLADKINEGGLWIEDRELSSEQKEHIKQEFAQIQSTENKRDFDKLDCKIKAEIRRDIGRSPDYRDAFLMRVWFDLNPKRRLLVSSKSRTLV